MVPAVYLASQSQPAIFCSFLISQSRISKYRLIVIEMDQTDHTRRGSGTSEKANTAFQEARQSPAYFDVKNVSITFLYFNSHNTTTRLYVIL